MRFTMLSLAGGLAMLAGGAQAMPLDGAVFSGPTPGVTLTSGGCGPGYHRDGYGYCRPGGGFFPYAPRAYGGYGYGGGYGYRRCFIREGYYGPRRVCRY